VIKFPIIDLELTGANILKLRKVKGLSVKDLQVYFKFECPQAIYKWQWGQSLPSIDNLFALSKLFDMSINEILVEKKSTEVFFLFWRVYMTEKELDLYQKYRPSSFCGLKFFSHEHNQCLHTQSKMASF
jgi:transcriptional regulator with XRE-family HTH domain